MSREAKNEADRPAEESTDQEVTSESMSGTKWADPARVTDDKDNSGGLAEKLRRRLLEGAHSKDGRAPCIAGLDGGNVVTIVVLGASGDLAKKKIYPVLWKLWKNRYISSSSVIVGYARSKLEQSELVERIAPYIKAKEHEQKAKEEFLKHCQYFAGAYDEEASFSKLNDYLVELEQNKCHAQPNRLFYLALPPSVFMPVTENIRHTCWAPAPATNRMIVEKPFGKDSASSAALSDHLGKLYQEKELYRIDHYLGKEMVQNLMVIRFANILLSPLWNRDSISCVQITFKEDFGTQGRGGYFDEFGIVRDILQNHLLQVLSIIAMEKPCSTDADDIRDEKVKVLKSIPALKLEDCVFGQYVADPTDGVEESSMGYRDDPGVPNDSKTPTFCTCVLKINNERWDGVPFIMRAGKALNERKAEIRIQFKDVPGNIFEESPVRNELVVRIQPDEAMWMKMMNKRPGLSFDASPTFLDLSYNERYRSAVMPDAYERLILEAIQGDQLHFVRSDELEQAWRIFTPMLHKVDNKENDVIEYKFGSRGPKESDEMVKANGYVYASDSADWSPPHTPPKL